MGAKVAAFQIVYRNPLYCARDGLAGYETRRLPMTYLTSALPLALAARMAREDSDGISYDVVDFATRRSVHQAPKTPPMDEIPF